MTQVCVYLVLGDDPYLVQTEIGALTEKVSALSVTEFTPADDIKFVIQTLETPPMFEATRVAILRGVEQVPAQAQRDLIQYLASPASDATLILVAEKASAKLVDAVKKVGKVIEAAKGKKSDVFEWLGAEAKQRGLQFVGDAMPRLLDAAGDDRMALANALDELQVALGAGARVGPDEVSAQFRSRANIKVFGFVDSVAIRQTGPALQALNRLLVQGEAPQLLLWNLIRHFRMLLGALEGSSAAVAKLLGLPAWRAEKLVRQARGFSPEMLARAYRTLAEADLKMKRSEELESLILERAVVKIAAARG